MNIDFTLLQSMYGKELPNSTKFFEDYTVHGVTRRLLGYAYRTQSNVTAFNRLNEDFTTFTKTLPVTNLEPIVTPTVELETNTVKGYQV